MTATHTHSGGQIQTFGADIQNAKSAVILIHGRGSNASDIIGLADVLTPETNVANPQIAWVAPQATLNVWYPFPFTEPIEKNEPALTSALTRIDELVDEALEAGIPSDRIALGGFSQGACLSLEYAARGTRKLGFVFAFAGGLIGPPKVERLPISDLAGLPIFIGAGTSDNLIGIDLVVRSVNLLRAAGAKVEFQDYPGVGHIVVNQEVLAVRTALTAFVS